MRVLKELFASFTGKRTQGNEADIERLTGAIIALEKALHLTLGQSIIGGNVPGEEGMTRDDIINLLIEQWEEASRVNQELVSISPYMQEGYLQIHDGFLKALRFLKSAS